MRERRWTVGRKARLRAAWLRPLLAGLLATSVADAQFNARGRRPPARSPGPSSAPAAQSPPPATSPSSRQSGPSREDQLIERYRRLIVEQPGEEVPLTRLSQLVRERDGSLEALLESVAEQAQQSSGAERYGAQVAWGGLLLADAKAEQALSPLQTATAEVPGRAPAWQLLSRVQRALGQQEQAAGSIEKAIPLLFGPDALSALRDLRSLRLDAEDWEGAEEAHAELVRRSADSSYVSGELARELLSRGQSERAITVLRDVLLAARGDARARLIALDDLGQALLTAGRSAEAIEVLSEAGRLAVGEPGRRHAIDLKLAEAHEAHGTLTDYLKELAERARAAPSFALLGRLFEQQGRTPEAIASYRKGLDRDPKDLDTRLRLVHLYELTGQLEDATEQVGRLTVTAPRDVQLSTRYMTMLLAQGERENALREWDRLERATRGDPEAGLALVDLAEQLAEPERAERVLRRLRGSGASARFFVELGARYFKRNEKELALSTWEKIKSAHSDPAAGLVMYGEVLIDHGFAERGLLAIAEAVERSPDQLEYRKSLGLTYERLASARQGRDAASYELLAIQTYQSILEQQATGSTASFARRHLVRLWHRRGELGTQVARMRKERPSRGGNVDSLRLLAEAEQKLGDRQAAIETWQDLLRRRAGDQEALTALVALHQSADDQERAIDTLERLVQADPNRARQYLEQMARAARAQGNGARALSYAERAASRSSGDPAALARLAELYLAEGQVDEAEQALRRALAQDDGLEEANLLLAELLNRKGEPNEAFDRLAHVLRTTRSVTARQTTGRRLLSLGHVVQRTVELEEMLRKLSIALPQNEEIRTLLLETLSAELAPLQLEVRYGSKEQAAKARKELAQVAARCRGPLLSALQSEKESERRLALALLGYDEQSTTRSALIAFAESSKSASARVQALLAIRNVTEPTLVERLEALSVTEGRVSGGSLPTAALLALTRSPPSATSAVMGRIADSVNSDPLRALALLALSRDGRLGRAERMKRADQARALAESRGAPLEARQAALLAWGGLTHSLGGEQSQELHISPQLWGADAPTEMRLSYLAASSLVAQRTGTSALPSLPNELMVTGLLDPSAEVRKGALLCSAGIPFGLELGGSGASSVDELVRWQLRQWLEQKVTEEQREQLRRRLGAHLVEASQAALLASPRGARAVLDRLSPGEFLHPLREEFVPMLQRMAAQDSPLRLQALALLRPSDGIGVRQLLERSLRPEPATEVDPKGATSAFDVVLTALAIAPTAQDVAWVETMEKGLTQGGSPEGGNWYSAYRIAGFYAAALQRGDERARSLARARLERLTLHGNELVASAARSALSP